MRVILSEDRVVADWAGRQVARPLANFSRAFIEPFTAIGFADDTGRLYGAIVLNAYSGPDVEMSVFGKGCWSRRVIRTVFDTLFNHMGCARVTVTVKASAPVTIRLAERLGFQREGVARRKFGNDDGVMMGMLKDECPWIDRERS